MDFLYYIRSININFAQISCNLRAIIINRHNDTMYIEDL